MKKYTQCLLFTLIITLTFFAIIISTVPILNQHCGTEGRVQFLPEFNKDYLSGVIGFSENKSGDKILVDGIFSTDIGIDGIKTADGTPRYTAELYNNKGAKLFDLTSSVFDNAIELVSLKKQFITLQICGKNSIIGKVVVIKRDHEEIARAEIYRLKPNVPRDL